MGYYTTFQITVSAAAEARRLEIVKKMLQLAHMAGTSDAKEILDNYQLSPKNQVYYSFSFDAKWYEWAKDVRGSWFDSNLAVYEGLVLQEGESVTILGYGDENDDIWKAFVSKRKFSQEHCAKVNWIHKEPVCECDGEDEDNNEKCTGCQGCAEREPVFD